MSVTWNTTSYQTEISGYNVCNSPSYSVHLIDHSLEFSSILTLLILKTLLSRFNTRYHNFPCFSTCTMLHFSSLILFFLEISKNAKFYFKFKSNGDTCRPIVDGDLFDKGHVLYKIINNN